ncbi:MAG: S58 family peptidase [Gemmatimonadales bacterium]|nr:MAG: S58 family peptidase [Gemmatimonadales bacterium]
MKYPIRACLVLSLATGGFAAPTMQAQDRPRARTLGVAPGILPTGALNAITDVPGVLVGQTTVVRGDSIRTGVTAILPHGGNLYRDRVPAAVFVINGFGKLIGTTQLHELGELETPILLTCTLCVWKAADAMVGYLLQQPGMGEVRSINPVVGETNDAYLNAIRERPITSADVVAALSGARSGPVAAGSVGAGTGTLTLGWKGGIGTSSRRVRVGDSTWTVGVLVQTNFGGSGGLLLMGVPVGRLLGRDGLSGAAAPRGPTGSIMIVVATDAPLSDRNLERLASRAAIGLGHTGATAGNGSGDYVLSFSTNPAVRRTAGAPWLDSPQLGNDVMSPLFAGVIEATEEAIDNALFAATTVTGNGHTAEALPVDEVLTLLRERQALVLPLPVPATRP